MTTYRIGIDVGGTNTDAVILGKTDTPLAKEKTPTTADITSGILNALDSVLDQSGVEKEAVGYVMLGTTHCTNAVTERKDLNDVGVLRIGAPATESIPPLFEWPSDLVSAIGNRIAILDGGHEFDGQLLNELDEPQIREQVREFNNVDSFAVTSVFSPVQDDHEERVAEIIRDEYDDTSVSISNEIGSVGLLERENATVLNAALTAVADEASSAFRTAMNERNIDARLYFGQNDGTLMSVEYATEYPIFTVASGPANSIRGAAYLSDVSDGIIIDVGGTTTDVGALVNGFPRESSVAVEIGEVKTNFRMPDLISLGIGGGSLVDLDNGSVEIGPESVGYELTNQSLAFGGETLTATDIEVADGAVDLGHQVPDVESELIEATRSYIRERVARAVDRMKTSADPIPVVVVGGGSILIPEEIEGANEVYKPKHYEVANAVGAAIAQVSGQVDRLYSLEDQSRDEALDAAKNEAKQNAIEAGADPATVEVVDVQEVPLSYLPGNAVRVKMKVAGDLDSEGS